MVEKRAFDHFSDLQYFVTLNKIKKENIISIHYGNIERIFPNGYTIFYWID